MTKQLTVSTVDPTTDRAQWEANHFPNQQRDLFEVAVTGGYVVIWLHDGNLWHVRVISANGPYFCPTMPLSESADRIVAEWETRHSLHGLDAAELREAVTLLQTVAELA